MDNFVLLSALLGLGGGIALGLAARLGEFCTFGAIESAYMGKNQTRARLWGIVLGVAIISVYLLQYLGQIDISKTLYHSFEWNPLASIIGGLIFGYGMALSGNCGFGALARFGGGDLKAMVVIMVMAIAGYITLSGPLAYVRLWLFPIVEAKSSQGFATIFGPSAMAQLVVACVVSILFIALALSYKPLFKKRSSLFWGVVAGLTIASAFWGNSVLHMMSFGQISVSGYTYTAPLGQSLLYLMTSSAGGLNFAVGSVFGVVIGAFIGCQIRGHFRWEACDDPRELGRLVFGACLMGIGGVTAVGCSIGQGVSAFTTLAYSGPVTLIAIVIGCVFGIRQLLAGFEP